MNVIKNGSDRRSFRHQVRPNAYIFMISRASNWGYDDCPLRDKRCWQGKSGTWFIELTASEFLDFHNQVGDIVVKPVDQRKHPDTTASIIIYDDYIE